VEAELLMALLLQVALAIRQMPPHLKETMAALALLMALLVVVVVQEPRAETAQVRRLLLVMAGTVQYLLFLAHQ
jgi:hypothetical protein